MIFLSPPRLRQMEMERTIRSSPMWEEVLLYWILVFMIAGEKIFMTKKENGWDGKINGQSQNSGIYIWMLKANDEHGNIINKKGTVALIR